MAKSGMPWPEIAGRQPAVSQMLDVGARHIVDFPLVVLAVSLLVQWLAAWLADAFRSRMRPLKELEREDYGIVLTASLTLLGLIIAFSFSMAVSRYDQRKNYEEAEANAIGTEYVRADLLPAADAARVRELLRRYLDQRVLFYTTRDGAQLRRIDADTTQLQSELWSTVRAAAAAQPTPLTAPRHIRHERRPELARIHSGRLVEPHSKRGVGPDGRDCRLLQPAPRLPRAYAGCAAVSGLAAFGVDLVLPDSRHR